MNDVKPHTFWRFRDTNIVVMAIAPRATPCRGGGAYYKACMDSCSKHPWKGLVVSSDDAFPYHTFLRVEDDFCLGSDKRYTREDKDESKNSNGD